MPNLLTKADEIPRWEYPKSHQTQRLWAQPQQCHRGSCSSESQAAPTPHFQQALPDALATSSTRSSEFTGWLQLGKGAVCRCAIACPGPGRATKYSIGNTPNHPTPSRACQISQGEINTPLEIPPNPSGWAWWAPRAGPGSHCRTTPHRHSCRSESRRSRSRAAPALTPSRSSLGHLQQAPDQVSALGASV
jgi:hypothetical protein